MDNDHEWSWPNTLDDGQILTKVDGLLETGGGEQAGSIADTTTCGNDLSTTTVDGIGVELHKRMSATEFER